MNTKLKTHGLLRVNATFANFVIDRVVYSRISLFLLITSHGHPTTPLVDSTLDYFQEAAGGLGVDLKIAFRLFN